MQNCTEIEWKPFCHLSGWQDNYIWRTNISNKLALLWYQFHINPNETQFVFIVFRLMYQIQAWFLLISYNWTDNLDISLFALWPYYHKMALFNIRNRNQIANTSYPKAVKSLFIIGVQMFVYGNLLGLVLLCLMLVQHKQN